MRIIIRIGLIFFFVLSFTLSGCSISRELQQVHDLAFGDLSLPSLADGEYRGEYGITLVSAEVAVIVKNHSIVSINLLKHSNGKGKPAEKILGEVVAKQTLHVDTVAGATISSKVILKAIERALSE